MSVQKKLCSACKVTKPLTEFYANCHSKDGHLTRCKICHSKILAALREERRLNYVPPNPEATKRCPKCKTNKLTKDFGVDRTKRDGLHGWCLDCARIYQKDWVDKNGGQAYQSKKNREWYEKNSELAKQKSMARHRVLRLKALEMYSDDGNPRCKCCGEKELKFLAIDHINGGGKQHLKEIRASNIYTWAKLNNYPPGFQVLCHNCNLAKGFYGRCPHQDQKSSL